MIYISTGRKKERKEMSHQFRENDRLNGSQVNIWMFIYLLTEMISIIFKRKTVPHLRDFLGSFHYFLFEIDATQYKFVRSESSACGQFFPVENNIEWLVTIDYIFKNCYNITSYSDTLLLLLSLSLLTHLFIHHSRYSPIFQFSTLNNNKFYISSREDKVNFIHRGIGWANWMLSRKMIIFT